MSKDFEKVVNAPHRAFGRATRNIKKMKPSSKMGQVGRIAGMGMSGLTQFLLWAAKYIALDNHLTRAGERMFKNSGKSKNSKIHRTFAQKYPNLSSHILYYMMLAMVAGGVKEHNSQATESHDGDNPGPASVELTMGNEKQIVAEPNTYGAYLARVQPIVPYLIADLIAKEGVHVNPKTGLHTPYRDSKGIPTIGFGSTVLKDGSKVTMKTKPITNEEAFELARWHLGEETFFIMYCYDIAIDAIDINTTQEALSMASVIYNAASKLIEDKNDKNHKERFARLRNDLEQYGYALPDSLVKQRFAELPVRSHESFGNAWLGGAPKNVVADKLGNYLAGGRGLQWRRWMEAGLLTGDITPQMLLDSPVNGIYEFYQRMGCKKESFFTGNVPNRRVNRNTYALFRKWLLNPVDRRGFSLSKLKKVSDYLPADVVLECRNGKCELENSDTKKEPTNMLFVPNNVLLNVFNTGVVDDVDQFVQQEKMQTVEVKSQKNKEDKTLSFNAGRNNVQNRFIRKLNTRKKNTNDMA